MYAAIDLTRPPHAARVPPILASWSDAERRRYATQTPEQARAMARRLNAESAARRTEPAKPIRAFARRGGALPRRVPPTPAPAAGPKPRATSPTPSPKRGKTFGQIARACYAERHEASARRHGWSERVAPAAAATTKARSFNELANQRRDGGGRDYLGELVVTSRRGAR